MFKAYSWFSRCVLFYHLPIVCKFSRDRCNVDHLDKNYRTPLHKTPNRSQGHIHIILKDLVITEFGSDKWVRLLKMSGFASEAEAPLCRSAGKKPACWIHTSVKLTCILLFVCANVCCKLLLYCHFLECIERQLFTSYASIGILAIADIAEARRQIRINWIDMDRWLLVLPFVTFTFGTAASNKSWYAVLF